jgi:four helix bundle protein
MDNKYNLEDRLIQFASAISDIVDAMPNTRAGNYVAGQMIRCGIAPALMYAEAQAAESRDDFIHKMKIALKQLKETRFCLKIIDTKHLVGHDEKQQSTIIVCHELVAILGKSIETAKQNLFKEIENKKKGK